MNARLLRAGSVAASFLISAVIAGATLADPGTWHHHESCPYGRANPAYACDASRHRVLVAGGYWPGRLPPDGVPSGYFDLWELKLDGATRWNLLQPQGSTPVIDGMVVDPAHDRLVAWTGYDSGAVMVLPLTGSGTWTTLATTGTAPPTGQNNLVFHDDLRNRMVVMSYAGSSIETWALSLDDATWTPLAQTGSLPDAYLDAQGTAVGYDPAGDRVFLQGNDSYFTWWLPLADGAEWQAFISGPSAPRTQYGMRMAYDSVRQRMVVTGGGTDSWVLSLGASPAWSHFATGPVTPPARYDHVTVYDPVLDRVLVACGDGNVTTEVWQLALGGTPAWSRTGITPPTGSPVAALDAVHDRMVVYDGATSVHTLSLADHETWSDIAVAGGPAPYTGFSVTLDTQRKRMLLFGGGPSALYQTGSSVWALTVSDPPTWAPIVGAGVGPLARVQSCIAYDSGHDRLVTFGGRDSMGNITRDVWALTLTGTPGWNYLGSPPGPVATMRAGTVYDPERDRLIVCGGYTASGPTSAVWAINLSGAPVWTSLPPLPTALDLPTAIYDPAHDRIIVYGGFYVGFLGTLTSSAAYELDLAHGTPWTTLSTGGPTPLPRGGHAAIYDPARSNMVTFGGWYDERVGPNDYRQAQLIDVNVLQWTPAVAVGTPAPPSASRIVAIGPNPAHGAVTFSVALAVPGAEALEVIDVAGRRVWHTSLRDAGAGLHVVRWDGRGTGSGHGSGVYFARLSGTTGARRFVRVE